jgi:hypothetical protein
MLAKATPATCSTRVDKGVLVSPVAGTDVAAAVKLAMAGAGKLDTAMPTRMLAVDVDGHADVAVAAKQGMAEVGKLDAATVGEGVAVWA